MFQNPIKRIPSYMYSLRLNTVIIYTGSKQCVFSGKISKRIIGELEKQFHKKGFFAKIFGTLCVFSDVKEEFSTLQISEPHIYVKKRHNMQK